MYISVSLPLKNLTLYASEGFLSYSKGFNCIHENEVRFSVKVPSTSGKTTLKVEEAVYNAVSTISWLGGKIAIKRGEDASYIEISFLNALRLLSLYMIALTMNSYSGFVPSAYSALPLKISLKSPSAEDMIRLYFGAKIQAILALKTTLTIDPDVMASVATSREEFEALHFNSSAKSDEKSPAVSRESKGASNKERVVVFQLAKDVYEYNKLIDFIKSYFKHGIYLKIALDPEKFSKRLTRAFRQIKKKGFLELSMLVAPGITYQHLIRCMTEAGVLKKEVLHNLEIGYQDHLAGKSMRVSEWYKLKGGLYMAVGHSRFEKIPLPLCEVHVRN